MTFMAFWFVVNILLEFATLLAATDCSLEVKDVQPISVSLGDKLVVVCPPNNPCSGEYVIEHLNHSTSQYEIIQSQIIQQEANRANVTIRKLSNAGYFRCSKRCNDGESDSPHCYFNAVVHPTTLEWNMPVGPVVNESYSLSCSATGYPAPYVYSKVQPHENCSYNYRYIKVDSYTGKALITIPRVSINCLKVYCHSARSDEYIDETQTLNITIAEENTSSSSSSTMSTTVPTTSATETTNETSIHDDCMDPTKGDGSNVSSNTPRSTILLLSTVIALCIY